MKESKEMHKLQNLQTPLGVTHSSHSMWLHFILEFWQLKAVFLFFISQRYIKRFRDVWCTTPQRIGFIAFHQKNT